MTIVTRAQWGARPPKNRPGVLAAPSGVTYHWGGPAVGAHGDHANCARKVRQWQAFHMDTRGWADIAYNLIVCPHGTVFEGRGVHARSAANGTNEGNAAHYAICYLSGEGEPLTEAAKRGLLAARTYLREQGKAGAEIKTHNQWKSTGCPGDAIRAWVKAGTPVATAKPAPTPTPAPAPEPVPAPVLEDAVFIVTDPRDPKPQYLTNLVTKRHIASLAELDDLRKSGALDGVRRITLAAATLDAIPTVAP